MLIVELDDVKPRNESDLPNLLTLVTVSTPDERFARLIGPKPTPRWTKGHVVCPRTDLSLTKTFDNYDRAKKAERRLIDRLEALRATKIATAEASVEFLKHLMEVARQLVMAERADDEGRLDEIKVLDPRKGALTQIFEEFTPDGQTALVEEVVEAVDDIVTPVRGSGWQSSYPGDQAVRRELRLALRRFSLPPTGDLYDRAYAYIRENY